eukprot:scaffold137323_cov127-Phaeocystis_antarctica.AAC.1
MGGTWAPRVAAVSLKNAPASSRSCCAKRASAGPSWRRAKPWSHSNSHALRKQVLARGSSTSYCRRRTRRRAKRSSEAAEPNTA